jgi:hypothetical protein
MIEIKIGEQEENDGSSVEIRWKDAPDNVAETDWNNEDQVWTKICNGIHGLLAELGPIPKNGWKVEFSCPDFKKLVEKGLTRQQYDERSEEDGE